jgi:predicted transcriptional regulator
VLLTRKLYDTQREVIQSLVPDRPQTCDELAAEVGVSVTAVQNAMRLLVRWDYAARTRHGHEYRYTLTPLGQRKLAWEMKQA